MSTLPEGIGLTPLDPQFREDPYPILHRLRREAPVFRDRTLNRWVLTRHDDVEFVLRDRDFLVDPRKSKPDAYHRVFESPDDDAEPSMLFLDDPQHARLRKLVSHAFTPRAVEKMRPRTRELAHDLLAQVEGDEFDVVDVLAAPLPAIAIAIMLGVDEKDRLQFKEWSETSNVAFFNPFSPPEVLNAGLEAAGHLANYFLGEIEDRRRRSRDDMISRLCEVEVEGERLSDAEIVSMCSLLLIAGNVTTTDLIGNSLRALMFHPEETAKLRSRPELLPEAIEEVLRYDSSVVLSARIAPYDFELDGHTIEKGESISVVLGAANRDPAVYPEPDRFDIGRVDKHHQSFGGGAHICLGAHLARLEAQEAIAALLEWSPELAPGNRPHVYRQVPSFRGLAEYWLRR